MICKICGAALNAGDVFCGGCGSPVMIERKKMTKCERCGTLTDAHSGVCSACGAPVGRKSAPPAPPVLPVTASFRCPGCGASLPSGAVFCGECGSPASSTSPFPGTYEPIADEPTVSFAHVAPEVAPAAPVSEPAYPPLPPTAPAAPTPIASDIPTAPVASPMYISTPGPIKTTMATKDKAFDPREVAEKARGKSFFGAPDDL